MSISSTCFGRQFRPSSGALDCVYSLWYKTPTMLPAGDQVTSRQRYTTSCKHSLVLLRMGEIIARNFSNCLKLLIKIYYCCIQLAVYIIVSKMHGHTDIKIISKFVLDPSRELIVTINDQSVLIYRRYMFLYECGLSLIISFLYG